MKTIFPSKRTFYLGQALSLAEREHYLLAISRALDEAKQISDWLGANPNARLAPPATVSESQTPPGITVSPYYTKWFNYQAIAPEMQALFERLAAPDPASWSSVTEDEHKTFGWVSVVDQIYAAWKADPKNLTAGTWVGGLRMADGPDSPEAIPPVVPLEVLGLTLPPTLLGMPTGAVLVVGGLGAVMIGWAIYSTRGR